VATSATAFAKAEALLLEGRRLFDAGLAADARELLGRAHALAPDHLACSRWLAEAQLTEGAFDAAAVTLSGALALAPSSPELIVLQAEIALKRGQLRSAEATLDAALEADGANATLLARRGGVHLLAGNHGAAAEALERSLMLDPNDCAVQSALIVAASYDPSTTTARLKGLQRRWKGPLASGSSVASAPASPATGRPMRVGYVSSAFHCHPAAQVFSAVLLHHDPAKVETYCYSSSRRRDWVSIRLGTAAKAWRSIAGLDDSAAVDLIRRDGIQILVDLDGHFRHNRLGIFSMRAAPVQVSAWGYVAGPGIPEIDYLITDRVTIPVEEARWFPERLVALGRAQPYNPDLMTRSTAPVRRAPGPDGIVRFGCFNRYDKLSEGGLKAWAEVLQACPRATLTLKDRFFAEAEPRDRIRTMLARCGVDPNRILFEPREAHADYLAAYDRIDLVLDPFPITGGVTTLDGLFQGVPAITLEGAEPMARIGASILTAFGQQRCICRSPREYVRAAVELGGDWPALAHLRADVLAATKFRDGPKTYADTVEAAYRDMWERHCRGDALAPSAS
jgi:protein O-GlcNAc transferase